MNAMGNSTLGHRYGLDDALAQIFIGCLLHVTHAQVYNEQLLSDGPLQPSRMEQGDCWTSSQAQFLHEQSYPKYYSFPKFKGVKADQAATSFQERASACKRVQAYYDVDPQTNAKQSLARIKGEFVGRLVDATGSELAGAEGGLEVT
ncbi:hypothetical protein BDR06DRAFT_1015741 [Suillus hirtellus]|nr:hypothetical protein BDR06DRAFT_1015741 [Suillus hirtellus]